MGASLSTDIIIISVVFSVVAIVAVALRLYARHIKHVGYGADDWFILPGVVFAVCLGIVDIIAAAEAGLGQHTPLSPEGVPMFKDMEKFLKCEFASQLLSVACLTCVKFSILLFYRRIFRGPVFDVVAYVVGAIILGWGLAFFFASLFECYPIKQVWTTEFGTPGRKCYNDVPMFYGTAGSNIVIDIMLLTIPWPMIWKLQMPTRQKIAVSGIFLLGSLVCGISIARLVFFVRAGKGYIDALDITYGIAPTIYWTQLESALAVVSACLPTMRPLFMGFSPESVIGTWRSKISIFSGRSKTSINSQSKQGYQSHESDDSSSMSGLTKGPNDAVIESRIEGTRMVDLEAPRTGTGPGIMVQKDIHYHNERV